MRIARFAALSQPPRGPPTSWGNSGLGETSDRVRTTVTPQEIITAAEANGVSLLPWAWDDNDLPGCKADNNWFSMTYECGQYTQPSDLTDYGQDVILNPSYGISVLAKRATIF